MTLRAAILIALTLPLLAGCAAQRTWQPTVDTNASRSPETLNQDRYECEQLALQASGDTAKEVGKGAVVGGAVGAASGAAIGAATGGNAGTGAAIGAAVAGIGGMLKQGTDNEAKYRAAYRSCMIGRGHNVVN